MEKIVEQGSARIDLLGGTLDLWPIHLILPDVVTLNAALSLKIEVTVRPLEEHKIVILSKDYQQRLELSLEELKRTDLTAGPLTFIIYLLQTFGDFKTGLELEVASHIPPGSGLGGSTVMGVTIYKALSRFLKREVSSEKIIKMVMDVESRILNQGPPGYQDGYPAVYGGILALRSFPGQIKVEQLYSEELKQFLQSHLTLVYSGLVRSSGINNWQVYKSFFDTSDHSIRNLLAEIAHLSGVAYQSLINRNYAMFLKCLADEGVVRKKLAPTIITDEMNAGYEALKNKFQGLGLKVCGAGGGGCFLLIHEEHQRNALLDEMKHLSLGWKQLPLDIEAPLSA